MAKLKNTIHETEFEGTAIQHLSDGQFAVDFKDDDTEKSDFQFFSRIDDARAEIHRVAIAANSVKDLDLMVVNNVGDSYKVRRIHASTGEWMTTPKTGRFSEYYKPCDDVDSLLKWRLDLRTQLDAVNAKLKPFELKMTKVFFRGIDKTAVLAAATEAFRKEWEAAPTSL